MSHHSPGVQWLQHNAMFVFKRHSSPSLEPKRGSVLQRNLNDKDCTTHGPVKATAIFFLVGGGGVGVNHVAYDSLLVTKEKSITLMIQWEDGY